MRTLTVAVLWALSAQATAQVVNKCVDWRGHATYQSDPCPSSSRHEKEWVSVPDAPRTREQIEADERIRRAAAEVRFRASQYTQPNGQRPTAAQIPAYQGKDPTGCSAAKTYRASVLKAVGMRRDFDLLRRLDDRVSRACK